MHEGIRARRHLGSPCWPPSRRACRPLHRQRPSSRPGRCGTAPASAPPRARQCRPGCKGPASRLCQEQTDTKTEDIDRERNEGQQSLMAKQVKQSSRHRPRHSLSHPPSLPHSLPPSLPPSSLTQSLTWQGGIVHHHAVVRREAGVGVGKGGPGKTEGGRKKRARGD
jgi:hypothetical protein